MPKTHISTLALPKGGTGRPPRLRHSISRLRRMMYWIPRSAEPRQSDLRADAAVFSQVDFDIPGTRTGTHYIRLGEKCFETLRGAYEFRRAVHSRNHLCVRSDSPPKHQIRRRYRWFCLAKELEHDTHPTYPPIQYGRSRRMPR